MAHSVIITTRMPTWEETVERYRLSKADQKFVASLFDDKRVKPTAHTSKTRAASSRPAKKQTDKAAGVSRKTKNRARKAA
jgi:hypothetical protein